MADETTPTPEETPAAPAEGTAPEAAAAPAEGAAPAPEATTEDAGYAGLPEGYEAWDEDALRAEAERLQTAITDGAPNVSTLAEMRPFEQMRSDVQTIADLLTQRAAEAEQLAASMETLTTPIELPERLPIAASTTQAAARQTVVAGVRERAPEMPPSNPDAADGGTPPSRVAAVAEVTERWRSASDGSPAHETMGQMFALNRPPRPTYEGQELGVMRPTVLASMAIDTTGDDVLTDSLSHNERLIAEVCDAHRQRRLAAMREGGVERVAGICDPPTIIRDATTCGSTATPFQATMPSLSARGGNQLEMKYRTPTLLASAVGGVRETTEAMQGDIDPTDPSTWKPCVDIACPSYSSEQAAEITACYNIDAWTELSSPEAEADFVHAKDRAFARYTEGWYLRKWDTFASHETYDASSAGRGGSALTSLIEAILTSIVWGNFGERLDPNEMTWTVALPPGLLDAVVISENKKAFASGVESRAAVQRAIEDATGAQIVTLFDAPLTNAEPGVLPSNPFAALGTPGGSDQALPNLSSLAFDLRVYDPSSFMTWNTGEATFGDQITLDQARQNKRGFFQRIFGGMMKPGCAPAIRVHVSGLCLDGGRTGFITPCGEPAAP